MVGDVELVEMFKMENYKQPSNGHINNQNHVNNIQI